MGKMHFRFLFVMLYPIIKMGRQHEIRGFVPSRPTLMYTMHPRVEEAELPEVESLEDGAYIRKEAEPPEENEDPWAAGPVKGCPQW